MSWFKRRPKLKVPPKPVPHHRRPITKKYLEEAKLKDPKKTSETK